MPREKKEGMLWKKKGMMEVFFLGHQKELIEKGVY